jgi:hypothetical protein
MTDPSGDGDILSKLLFFQKGLDTGGLLPYASPIQLKTSSTSLDHQGKFGSAEGVCNNEGFDVHSPDQKLLLF